MRCQVEGLVAPVRDVRPLWTRRHLHTVHVESVSIVRRYVHHESRGHRCQVEASSRVEHGEAVTWYSGRRDPVSRWRAVEYARLLRPDRRRERGDRRESKAPDQRARFLTAAANVRTFEASLEFLESASNCDASELSALRRWLAEPTS